MGRLQGSAVASQVVRYSVASVGPVGSAGAQFLLSLVLLRALTPGEFGSFAFLMVASQFSAGLWSALFCAPLPVLLTQGDEASREDVLRSLFASSLAFAAIAFVLFAWLGTSLGVPSLASVYFAGYAAVSLLRWFARTHAYAIGRPLRTMVSDLVYSLALLAGVGLIAFSGIAPLGMSCAVLLLGAVLGLLPFGGQYLVQQFVHVAARDLRRYGAVWRQHSGWSLVGVITTEATTNAHAYIVTGIYGPSAFAAVAASGLLIRPIQVTMNALTEFERAQMARQIGTGQLRAAMASVRFFRMVLIASWLATTVAAALVLTYAPHLVFPEHYDSSFLALGVTLWMAVAGMRLLRTPESTLLQGAGAFRSLAYASMISSGISIAAVFAMLTAGGPMWSIAGILVGETVIALCVWIQARRWRIAETARLGGHPQPAAPVPVVPLGLLVAEDPQWPS